MSLEIAEKKLCKYCGDTYPWTPQYFHYMYKARGILHYYCKSCMVDYVMSRKHGKPFQKIVRNKKEAHFKMSATFRAKREAKFGSDAMRLQAEAKAKATINLFFSDKISTKDLEKGIEPHYGIATDHVVKNLRKQMGL